MELPKKRTAQSCFSAWRFNYDCWEVRCTSIYREFFSFSTWTIL